MLSHEALVQTISDVIYDHVKGKHKDKISRDLAEQIIEILELDEPESWYRDWETDRKSTRLNSSHRL